MTRTPTFSHLAALLVFAAPAALQAQTGGAAPATRSAVDPTARLRAVLPADVADRVLARIAEARGRGLAADALEQRALKFAARGIAPPAIERAVGEHAERQARAAEALGRARGGRPAADEIDAGAEALRQGVDGTAVAALAQSAPSGRSLAVPLHVLGALRARGLPADEALARVRERLAARAGDAELAALPERAAGAADAARGTERGGRPEGVGGGRPATTGRDLAATRRPGSAGGAGAAAGGTGVGGGPPAGVPANRGAGGRPTTPAGGRPTGGRPAGRP
jgi:hypothetical protein